MKNNKQCTVVVSGPICRKN